MKVKTAIIAACITSATAITIAVIINKRMDSRSEIVPKKPNDREVNEEDTQRIKNKVPIDYIISIAYSVRDPESAMYGQDLSNKLISIGYKVELILAGEARAGDPNPRFDLRVYEQSKTASITIEQLPRPKVIGQ